MENLFKRNTFTIIATVFFVIIGFVSFSYADITEKRQSSLSLEDAVLVTLVGVLWFKVPIRGNILLLFGSTCLYLLTTLGVGLFISTLASTQQEAMMSTFFFYFPAVLLSGFMFPIANMPKIIQYITYLNPLRYFLVILRGIFLKGSGANILWPQMLALLIMGVGILTLSSMRFQKRLG